jgi:outer membrane protein
MIRRVACVAACIVALPAQAADPVGYVHLGASYVRQADDATLFLMGNVIPGAAFTTEGQPTVSVEAGLFVIEGLAVAVSGMIPATTPNTAAGTLAGLGNLGDETVGFYSATAQYHFALGDTVTPYVGAGLGYMHVFDTTDGAVSDMSIASAFGGVIQGGAEFALTGNLGLFVDVKRYFISTTASGTMGGAPITADARVDPWVVSTGFSIGF